MIYIRRKKLKTDQVFPREAAVFSSSTTVFRKAQIGKFKGAAYIALIEPFMTGSHSQWVEALPHFLEQYPDRLPVELTSFLWEKSQVLPVGIDLSLLDRAKELGIQRKEEIAPSTRIIVWNHRWEYDKNPELFFSVINELAVENIDFQLVLLGENFNENLEQYRIFKRDYSNRILHSGYCKSSEDYAAWLWTSDIIPITSIQEFFGVSVLEAVACECLPLAPNRLSYPEVLQLESHSEWRYSNKTELLSQLVLQKSFQTGHLELRGV